MKFDTRNRTASSEQSNEISPEDLSPDDIRQGVIVLDSKSKRRRYAIWIGATSIFAVIVVALLWPS